MIGLFKFISPLRSSKSRLPRTTMMGEAFNRTVHTLCFSGPRPHERPATVPAASFSLIFFSIHPLFLSPPITSSLTCSSLLASTNARKTEDRSKGREGSLSLSHSHAPSISLSIYISIYPSLTRNLSLSHSLCLSHTIYLSLTYNLSLTQSIYL